MQLLTRPSKPPGCGSKPPSSRTAPGRLLNGFDCALDLREGDDAGPQDLLAPGALDHERRRRVEPERLCVAPGLRELCVPFRALAIGVPLRDVADTCGLGDRGEEGVGHVAA